MARPWGGVGVCMRMVGSRAAGVTRSGVCWVGQGPGTVERLLAPLALRAATAWFWFGKSTSRGVHFFLDIGTDCYMFCVPHSSGSDLLSHIDGRWRGSSGGPYTTSQRRQVGFPALGRVLREP